MKTYIAKFWRSNPQFKNGGYETTRTIIAKTIASAQKRAKEIEKHTVYGSMNLLTIELQ